MMRYGWTGLIGVLLVGGCVQADDSVNAERELDREAVSRLRQLGSSIAQYATDHQQQLPDLRSPAKFQAALLPYIKISWTFIDPVTTDMFRLNATMQGRLFKDNPELIVLFTTPRLNGDRLVLFNDGHAASVGWNWWKLKSQEMNVTEPDMVVELNLQHLAAIGKALAGYVQDGDHTLPPLNDPLATRQALSPYAEAKEVFDLPGTKEAYAMNAALARRRFPDIPAPATVVVFYESNPTNATRGVLYLNGKVERVQESQWPALKERSGIR